MSLRSQDRFKISNLKNREGYIGVVSGLPRSGTSMMMKMLEVGGLEVLTDNIRTADENNPKGYYEFERVKKLMEGDTEWLQMAKGKAVKVISTLLEALPKDYSYKVIFMRREINEILASQRQMLIKRNEPTDRVSDDKLAELYNKHLAKIEVWLKQQQHMEVLYINYNEVIRDPFPQIIEIDQLFGNQLDLQRMAQVVDQNLYRQRH
jgi:Sulfotransferase domain